MAEYKDAEMSKADEALKTELLSEVESRLARLNAKRQDLVNKLTGFRNLLSKLQNSEATEEEIFDIQMHCEDTQEKQLNVESSIASERTLLAKINLIGRKEPTLNKVMKVLPPSAFKNQQLDMFRRFLVNSDKESRELSNAIDLWDSVPRYSVSRAKQVELRVDGGFLPIAEFEFQYKGRTFTAEIHPARIKTKDKKGKSSTLEFYPSGREELVEHALRKLASEQQAGFLDIENSRSGVTFTLHQLRTELELRGHSMRYDELMESLDVMNLSNIRLIEKGVNQKDPSFISQPYLPALSKVTKEDRASDSEAKWFVQFHGALTASITQFTYRQFNYQRLMNCQSQISRWLISQLVLKYTYAALGNTFLMLYSTIKRDSGLLDNYKRARDAISAVDDAFAELKSEGVLMSFVKETRLGLRGKIEDATYTLSPTAKFASEQKAANKRLGNSNVTVLKVVDN